MSDLKDRIKEAAEEVGGLNKLATLTDIPRRTLGHYVDGSTEPKVSQLITIAEVTRTSIEWLASGRGQKSRTSARKPVDDDEYLKHLPDLVHDMGLMITRVYHEEDIKLPIAAMIKEIPRLYGELLDKAEDPRDHTELQALLPWLEARLRRELRDAHEAPGTGKRSA